MITHQEVLSKKLLYIVHCAFVDVRNSAFAGDPQKLFDLGDAFEIVPTLMSDAARENIVLIREILAKFQAKHQNGIIDYLSILDMNDEKFLELYGHRGGYR